MSTFARSEKNLSSLPERLEKYNITPKRSLGQSFLVDRATIDAIVRDLLSRMTDERDLFVEIGTGPGFLTHDLARSGHPVVSIEIDRRFIPFHEDLFSDLPEKPVMIYDDARRIDVTEITDALRRREGERSKEKTGDAPAFRGNLREGSFVVFGNLPYGITTELILSTLTHFPGMRRAVFMIQTDVTARLVARPGDKRYGPLAIATSLFGMWRMGKTVSRQAFYPSPHVTSRLVELIPSEDADARRLGGDPRFHTFLAALFQGRRKTLPNALSLIAEGDDRIKDPDGALASFLEQHNLTPAARAESLTPTQLGALFQRFQSVDCEKSPNSV